MPRIQQIARYSILVIAAIPAMMSALFLFMQWQYKHQHWEQLEHAAAIQIELPADALDWVKPNKEIRYQGHYFDVFSYHATDHGTVLLTGIYDNTEEALEKQFHQQTNQQTQKRSGQLTHFLQQLLFIDDRTDWKNEVLQQLSRKTPTQLQSVLPIMFLAVSTPPPDWMMTMNKH